MQHIDGVVLDKPYQLFVDPMNMKTDKRVYHHGDTISILTSICKYRNYTAKTTWRIVNATVIYFPEQASRVSGIGCLKDKWITIGKVPLYTQFGTHHLEGSSEIQLNELHSIHADFRSEDFLIE